jgi:hypothetical protein
LFLPIRHHAARADLVKISVSFVQQVANDEKTTCAHSVDNVRAGACDDVSSDHVRYYDNHYNNDDNDCASTGSYDDWRRYNHIQPGRN